MSDTPILNVKKVLAETYPVKRGGIKLAGGGRYGFKEIFYTDELPAADTGETINIPNYGLATVHYKNDEIMHVETETGPARIEKTYASDVIRFHDTFGDGPKIG